MGGPGPWTLIPLPGRIKQTLLRLNIDNRTTVMITESLHRPRISFNVPGRLTVCVILKEDPHPPTPPSRHEPSKGRKRY